MKYVILLTACINPDGMAFTKLTDPDERKKQYINAINYYVSNTTLPIVFVENSNTDISLLFDATIRSGRLEMFTFKGNKDKVRGKGYGEAEIIDYALNHSKIIDEASILIKITGRLVIYNVMKLVTSRNSFCLNRSVQCTVNSEFSFADSRILIAPVAFIKQILVERLKINDSKHVFFEHILLKIIKEEHSFYYFPFILEPQITGMSGSTGEQYKKVKSSFKKWMLYINYQLYLIVIHPNYSLKRIAILPRFLINSMYFIIKIYCKILG